METKTPVPGPTHPDVHILKGVFLSLQPGETIAYDAAAKAIGHEGNDPIFRRRADVARRQLKHEAVVECVRGVGFIRETSLQTLERTRQSARPSIRRKAQRVGRQLSLIDPSRLDDATRSEYFTERTVNNVVFVACSRVTRKNVLAATKVSNTILPMAKAIEAMAGKNGTTPSEPDA